MSGYFITFEGGEGAGKTSQINRLADSLTQQGHRVVTTREPGGTPESEKIRGLLVQRNTGHWSPMSEALMMFAARVLHVERVILPALKDDKIVICDRFTDSTRAYQGYGHGVALSTIEGLVDLTLNGLEPYLTIILDIDPMIGLKRSERRLASQAMDIEQREDRFENLDISFHEKLRQGFLKIAKQYPSRCYVFDASAAFDEISKSIWDLSVKSIGSI